MCKLALTRNPDLIQPTTPDPNPNDPRPLHCWYRTDTVAHYILLSACCGIAAAVTVLLYIRSTVRYNKPFRRQPVG